MNNNCQEHIMKSNRVENYKEALFKCEKYIRDIGADYITISEVREAYDFVCATYRRLQKEEPLVVIANTWNIKCAVSISNVRKDLCIVRDILGDSIARETENISFNYMHRPTSKAVEWIW